MTHPLGWTARIPDEQSQDYNGNRLDPIQMNRLNAYGRAFWTGAAVLMAISTPTSAFGDWWIVRSSDEKCLVVDVEPTPGDEGVTKIGKENYQSAQEAEADLKRICGESDAGFAVK